MSLFARLSNRLTVAPRNAVAVQRIEPSWPAAVMNIDSGITATSLSYSELMEAIGAMADESGEVVTPTTALQVSAVFACIRLIAGAKASLPVDFYRRGADSTRTLVEDHPLWWVFNERPSPAISAAAFWEYIEASRHLYGDGFALLIRDGYGTIQEALPIHPLAVAPFRIDNELNYAVQVKPGLTRAVNQADMLHFTNFGFDGLRGMSTIAWGARRGIGIALAADKHSANYYRNATTAKVALTYDGKLDNDQIESLRTQWASRYSGSTNAGKPIVLTQGGKVEQLSMSAADAQLLQSRQFQVIDIARTFGVPPFMIGETDKASAWGTGVSEMGQGFINYTLQPHLVRDEQELNYKLFKTAKNYVEFDRSALLRGDLTKLGDYYRQAIGGSQGPGWMTVDEIRRLEKLKPIGADAAQLYRQANPSQPAPGAKP